MAQVRLRQPGAHIRLIFDGQSLNLSPPDEGNILGWSYPFHLTRNRGLPWSNVAISGQSWTQLATSAATRLHPLCNKADYTILIMCGGTTDITGGDTGQTAYDDEVAYALAARLAGVTHVINTTLVGHVGMNAGHHTQREARNALMLSDPDDAFDGVADLDTTALADWTDTAYYFDGVHWYDPGAILAAQTVAPVLDAVLASIP